MRVSGISSERLLCRVPRWSCLKLNIVTHVVYPTSSFTYFGDTFPSLHLFRDTFSVAISRSFLAVISNLNISTDKIKEKRRQMFVDAVGYKYTYRTI